MTPMLNVNFRVRMYRMADGTPSPNVWEVRTPAGTFVEAWADRDDAIARARQLHEQASVDVEFGRITREHLARVQADGRAIIAEEQPEVDLVDAAADESFLDQLRDLVQHALEQREAEHQCDNGCRQFGCWAD